MTDDDGVREPHADLGHVAGDQRHRNTTLQAEFVAETGGRFGTQGGRFQFLVRHRSTSRLPRLTLHITDRADEPSRNPTTGALQTN